MKPTIGRIVMFRDSVTDQADHPAMITGMDESPEFVWLTVFYRMYTMSGVKARYSEENLGGTWHWPVITPVMQGKDDNG